VPIILESKTDTSGQTIQVDIPEGTIFKDSDQNTYQETVSAPEFLQENQIQNPPANDIIAIIQVGSPSEQLHFEDKDQNTSFVEITIPLPQQEPGEKVNIYSSSEGSDRSILTQTTILADESSQSQSGAYVTFKTSHFTLFAIGTTNIITWNNMEFITPNFRSARPKS